MDADVKLYQELKNKLNEVKNVCNKISDKEKPSMVKLRIIPILNRITSYEEWFDGLADEEKIKEAVKKINAIKKTKEGRDKILKMAASLPDADEE